MTVACGGGAVPPSAAPATASGPELPGAPDSAPRPAPSSELVAGIKAFDAGKFADARKSFELAAKKNPSNDEALYNLGLTCEKLGDKAAAEAAYKAALAAKPDLESAAAELCALYVDESRIDDALGVARAALAIHPRSAPLEENLATALAAQGDRESATRAFDAAVQIAPNEPMFHLTFAHWLNVWHEPGASPHLATAVGLAKDDYAMLASVGYEYRMAGDFSACIKVFERAIAMKDGGEVRTQRALCRLGMKDEKAAVEDLQAAVAAEPAYAPAHYYLGGRLAIGKRFKDAAGEYAKYLELDPNGSLAKQAAERLRAAQDASGKGASKRR